MASINECLLQNLLRGINLCEGPFAVGKGVEHETNLDLRGCLWTRSAYAGVRSSTNTTNLIKLRPKGARANLMVRTTVRAPWSTILLLLLWRFPYSQSVWRENHLGVVATLISGLALYWVR